MSCNIHKTVIVEKGAQIGENVTIKPYAIIGKNAVIEDNVGIGAYVNIKNHCVIGEGTKIFQGCSVGGITQAFGYEGNDSYLKIGKNNVIREFCTLNATEGEGNSTVIGDNNLLMAYVHVAHHCVIMNNVTMSNSVTLGGHVTIENRAVLGGLSAVHQFCNIGEYVMIGGLAKIVKDVVPYCTVDGNPSKMCGLNLIGLQRAVAREEMTEEDVTELKRAYKILFKSQLNTKQALKELEDIAHNTFVKKMIEFVQNSERGIIKKN